VSDPAARSPKERWQQVDEILGLALDAPPEERAAVVAQACAGDPDLMQEVEGLLLADQQAARFLEPPVRPAVSGDTASIGSGLSAPRAALPAGTILANRYRIEEHIGQGGMGAVYRARDLVLDAEVAVKVLDRQLLARSGRMDALRREVRLARRVTHPNVCRVHDVVEDGEVAFITMEYVEGESLAERLERLDALPAAACRDVLRDVARGLGAAHAAGVIHRDLKPGNVLLRKGTDAAVVADFGVAAEAARDGRAEALRAGTRGYMAPEQAAGAPPDARSDLYSLGVLAQRMAGGRLPGVETTLDLPPEVADLVKACLRPDPSERPADAHAALRLLDGAGRPQAPRFRVRLLLAGGLLTTIVLGALLGARQWRPVDAPFDPAGLVLASVDTTQLEPREAWLGEALQRLVVDDLIDAWSVEARVAPNAPAPETGIHCRLWRDAGGRLRASLRLPRARSPHEIPGSSLRELAEGASRRIAFALVAPAARHPTAQELREVGASDPEAWRQLRRARRAARMEHWARVRALARDAVDRDPDFCMAWLELDLTYNKEDRAREPILDKVVELGERAPGLSPLSRLAVEFARHSRRKDDAAVGRVLERLGALELTGQDLLYIKTRLALSFFARGEAETGLPLFEWIAEKWPQDAAAAKKLADYYLGEDEPVSLPLALRHGRRAVALAPEDVAARANLARALLLAGDRASLRGHLEVIDMADPDDKQGAFLGERTNRLFALHMALGDVEEAAADARRLVMGSGIQHAQGQEALARIALSRGAFDEGLEGLGATAAEYEGLHLDAMALSAHWQHAWQAYALGRHSAVAAISGRARRLAPALDDSLGAKFARRLDALAALARVEADPVAADPAAEDALRKRLELLPAQGGWRRRRAYFDLLARYRRADWAGAVADYRDLEASGVPLAVAYQAADALERLGRRDEAVRVYEQLAMHPLAWHQPYRRGCAWLRLGILREEDGDHEGARQAFDSLLRLWDRAPRGMAEIRDAERRLAGLRAGR
jgi:serine/threonine protein kinase